MAQRYWVTVLWLFILNAVVSLHGQSFVFTVTNTPDPILIGSNLNYSLSVSNATGQNLNPGVLTSEYNTNFADLILVTNQANIITNIDTNTPGLVIFEIPPNGLPINEVLEVLLEFRGTAAGLFTNRFRIVIADQGRTDPAETNVVSTIIAQADLSVSVAGPSDGVFVGDTFDYQLLAANTGPDTVPGVVVSNPLPVNVTLLGLSPSNSIEVTEGSVLFSVGSLTNQESATATLSVIATNATGSNLISALIRAEYVRDADTNNNTFSTNVPIRTPLLGQIIVTNLFDQEFNPQTGWMEQRVILQNISTSGVDSVRLLVDELTNALVNVQATNGSTPYVAHGAPLGAGEQVELLLEYFNPTRTPGANPELTAYGTPALNLTPEEGSGTAVDRILLINFTNAPDPGLVKNNGRFLLEWPVTNSGPFQVIYDGNAGFTNAKGSLPLLTVPAGANRVQWLDYGPPRTLTAPSDATSRFYRVIQLP